MYIKNIGAHAEKHNLKGYDSRYTSSEYELLLHLTVKGEKQKIMWKKSTEQKLLSGPGVKIILANYIYCLTKLKALHFICHRYRQ